MSSRRIIDRRFFEQSSIFLRNRISNIPFQFMESASIWFVLWSFGFSLLAVYRIFRVHALRLPGAADGPIATELAGLPLTFAHVVAFYFAAINADIFGMLIFLWWGPGFVGIVIFYLVARARKYRINWHPWRKPIAWACKLNYWAIVMVMIYKGMWLMTFAYSVWIINDQIVRLFLANDADRLRRTLDDFWLPRLAYPLGLFIPLFVEVPEQLYLIAYGMILFTLWCCGIVRILAIGKLRDRPEDTELLRNMAYFKPVKNDN